MSRNPLPVIPPPAGLALLERSVWIACATWEDRSRAWQKHLPQIVEDLMLTLMNRRTPNSFETYFMNTPHFRRCTGMSS